MYQKILVFRYNSKTKTRVTRESMLRNETLTMTKSNLTLTLTSYYHLYTFLLYYCVKVQNK